MATGQQLAAECPVKAAKAFLGRAVDFEAKQEPCVAYYLRTHALNVVMASPRDAPTKKFLIALLDFCEKEKARLADKLAEADGRLIVTTAALKLFTKADDLERQTCQASDKVRNLFFTSSVLFEATAQFNEGKMDPVAAEKHKYARYIAGLMNKALEQGIPYKSPNGDPIGDPNAVEAYDALPTLPPPPPPQQQQQLQQQPPQSYQAQQPPPLQQQYQYPPPPQGYQQPPPQQQPYQPPPPQQQQPPQQQYQQQQFQQPPPQQYQQQPPPPPQQQQYQQPQQQYQQPPPPQQPQQVVYQQPTTSETMRAPASRQDAKAKADRVVAAEKCCRQAIAALQFFDEATARAQLLQAAAILDPGASHHHHTA